MSTSKVFTARAVIVGMGAVRAVQAQPPKQEPGQAGASENRV